MQKRLHERGAVSLFIVIFTALLVTVLTLSFVRIMVRDQQQATATDLSQSAYDSAQAGVEDAKRALLVYQKACQNGDTATCTSYKAAFDAQNCTTLNATLGSGSQQETIVQQSSGAGNDGALDQAYTCVKISPAGDYVNELSAFQSKFIPLRGTGEFNQIELSWFSNKDLTATTGGTAVNLAPSSGNVLVNQSSWPANRPALMRSQLVQPGGSFRIEEFDDSKTNTLFLLPSNAGGSTIGFASNGRKSATLNEPRPVRCEANMPAGGYACRVTLGTTGAVPAGQTAYLRLSALYNRAQFRIALKRDSADVPFDSVQFLVDSTGRANSLFRRVESRVQLYDDNFPYPEAAVDVTGNLCKDFIITNSEDDYSSSCSP